MGAEIDEYGFYTSDYIWDLKLQNRCLKNQLNAFRNGHAYQLLLRFVDHVTRKKNAEIKALNRKLATAINETISSRKAWSDIFDDIERERKKERESWNREKIRLEERNLTVERQRDTAKDEAKEWRHKYYEQSAEIERLQGENKKLTAQINKDFQNSSIPSSQQGSGRKKIPNSRGKSERKPGGQPGHKGHRLQQRKPTISHTLPDPEEFVNNPDYYKTEETITRQKIGIHVSVYVEEYVANVFRNRITGSRVHAPFPKGFDTDVSYDNSVKATAFLLANEANVSAEKVSQFLHELTHGEITISEATVNGLSKEFAQKSEPEQLEAIKSLMTSPVVNADFTNANVNGTAKQVLIMASPSRDSCMYFARNYKGHKGIIGTPLEDYVGTIVHDHDSTFYNYGKAHQECMQHNIRYLIGSIENEPELEWNKQMLSLMREMIHYRNSLGDNEPSKEMVAELEKRYDVILEKAKQEYEDVPPSDYYRDGYNLYLRLVKYKENELLFLHDMCVPTNNSLAERLARVYKRKQKQQIVLRSNENFIYLCKNLGVIQTFRHQDKDNLYDRTSEVFSRKRPRLKSDTKTQKPVSS